MKILTDILSTSEMEEVASYFSVAYKQTCEMYTTPEAKEKLLETVQQIHTRYRIYAMCEQETVVNASNLVFGDAFNTDFILTLGSLFSARWGMDNLKNIKLTNTLSSTGAGFTSNTGIPTVLGKTFKDQDAIANVLVNNLWLVMLLMIKIYTTLHPTPVVREKAKVTA